MAVEPTNTSPDNNDKGADHGPGNKPRHELGHIQRTALHAGLRLAGAAAGKQKFLSPEQIEDLEGAAHNAVDNNLYRNELDNLRDPSWYKRTAVGAGKQALATTVGKYKKAIIATVAVNLFAIAILLMLATLGPWKHIHFETIMRAVNFARFQTVIHGYASRVVFEASVLTDDSEGTFKRSPLVHQILLATPDKQVKQLGRDGRLKFEFHPNHSFGSGLIPLSESLKAVVIDGERIAIDDIAQRDFNKPYKELSRRDKWRVESRFIKEVKFRLGDIMAMMPRHVRFNPMYQVRQRTGMHLLKWLNDARDTRGMSPDDAKSHLVDRTLEQVMGPEENLPKSSNGELSEEGKKMRESEIQAVKTGESPGQVRSRIASRMKTVGTVSDVAFVLTSTCIIHDLANSFASYQDEREAMAMRLAGNEMSGTDQEKTGPLTGEAFGAMSSSWDGHGESPPAHMSVAYREVTGQNQIGDQAEINRQMEVVPWLKPVAAFSQAVIVADRVLNYGALSIISEDLNKLIVDKFCGAVLDEVTQYTIGAAELLITVASLGTVKGVTTAVKAVVSLGMHAAVGYAANELLTMLIQKAVMEFSGLAFAGITQGADRFNTDMVAYSTLSQAPNRMVYGNMMTHAEASQAQTVAMNELRDENRKKPLTERYFAIDNPFSLLGMVVARIPMSVGGATNTVHNGAAFLGSLLTSPFRLIGSIADGSVLFDRAYAADNTTFLSSDFGVEEWGWTVQEMERIETDESFSLKPLVQRVEPKIDELNARYTKCYDFSSFAVQSERPAECTREFLSGGHPKYGDDALYWRYYNALMFSAQVMTGDV